jgi:dGTPase
VLGIEDFPAHLVAGFGPPGRAWIGSMIHMVVEASQAAGEVTMRPEDLERMTELRTWMFDNVYLRPEAQLQSEKAIKVIQDLFEWFCAHPDEVPAACRETADDDLQAAMDHVAGMTDRFAIREHDRLFRPSGLY